MKTLNLTLDNFEECFPEDFTPYEKACAKTLFYKVFALKMHEFYRGKMQTLPKAPVYGFNWFNAWYTPGVSRISTHIRDANDSSYDLSNRGNLVAVVSDSTRVLGDGNCTPPGGLGVMEGKAFLMKYLGGIDAIALCLDSRNSKGEHDPEKIIDFVKMVQPSFGAINLEDISQPNCYRVLDVLREECDIPVWHDDAQGTACVTLAGLINALKLVNKKIEDVRIVYLGAGASNTTIARVVNQAGGDPAKAIMFDSKGALHKGRKDIETDPRFYRKWELCQTTNPKQIDTMEEAIKGADVLLSLSTPGPDLVKQNWIQIMGSKPVVFVCANPVPEIYPYSAKEAGAYIVATGRGDFPNQVNNSVGFPGILKGALLVRARKITDEMTIAAAKSIADFSEKRGIHTENIIANMNETEVFPHEAADVAMQAIKDGVARIKMTWQEAYDKAWHDISHTRKMTKFMQENGLIEEPPARILQESLDTAIRKVRL
ncbi:MAG: NADP-dependent malic enzyme [Bacteroidetes bacterium]|nr:MAG: NADP-dependent malic enzyme [Bacteroidota bacterium]